jgi:phosphoribosylformimino-5-aminoimidazole carboxamide ribotide isomerase
MLAIPALDLREGHVVQLVGGDYAKESIRLERPRDVAREWNNQGFLRLHVVDLDAATARGSNRQVVRDLLADGVCPMQVGGGIRSDDDIRALVDDGAEWIVVGTRALEEPDWLEEMAGTYPGRLIVATDVKERNMVTRGWSRQLRRTILDVVDDMRGLALGGLLVTAVHREGLLQGTDLPLMEDVAEASAWPVYASGGIATMADLRALGDRGVAGAVLGMALYTGTLDPRVVAEEFAQ